MRLATLFLALFLVVSIGFTHEPHPRMESEDPICCPHRSNKFDAPDLSSEQINLIETIKTENRKIIGPLRAEIELKEIELDTEMKKEKPDRAKIMQIIKEIHDLELKIKEAEIDQKLKIHSLLTPRQREKMRMSKPRCKCRCDKR